MKYLIDYLNEKKVPFAIRFNYLDNTINLFGVLITKKGKFYRANGKIISGNMVEDIEKAKAGYYENDL